MTAVTWGSTRLLLLTYKKAQSASRTTSLLGRQLDTRKTGEFPSVFRSVYTLVDGRCSDTVEGVRRGVLMCAVPENARLRESIGQLDVDIVDREVTRRLLMNLSS